MPGWRKGEFASPKAGGSLEAGVAAVGDPGCGCTGSRDEAMKGLAGHCEVSSSNSCELGSQESDTI